MKFVVVIILVLVVWIIAYMIQYTIRRSEEVRSQSEEIKRRGGGGGRRYINIPVRPGRRLYYSYRTVLKYIKKRKEMYERNCTCKSTETREI